MTSGQASRNEPHRPYAQRSYPHPPARVVLTRPWRPLQPTGTPTLDAANRAASARLASELS
eukprot:5774713-Pleurochrysis_carterae.AAC.1